MKLAQRSYLKLASAIAAVLSLAACGGGSDTSSATPTANINATSSSSSSSNTSIAAVTAFPVGLAVGSPAEASSVQSFAALAPKVGAVRYATDFGRSLQRNASTGNWAGVASLASVLLPGSSAYAANGSNFSLSTAAATIETVLSGGSSVSLDTVLNFGGLFRSGGNANCYGPSIAYSNHENATLGQSNSGTLPGGDLGLWTEYNAGTTPCVAAQLNQRVSGVKAQTMQGLLMMAAMRYTVSSNSTLSMPSAGGTTNLTSAFESLLHSYSAFSSLNVDAATISLDSTGEIYTFRLVIDDGSSGASARKGEVTMLHNPGSSASEYTGVMRVAAFSLSNDGVMGCSNVKDSTTGLYQVASVSSLRYARNGDDIDFSARNANYCGTPANGSNNYAADVASFDSANELNPSIQNMARLDASSKGWLGNFSRFAGSYDSALVEGNFLYAWQAGVGDGNSRMLSMNMDFNSVSSSYTLQGFFGYADDIDTTNGALLGMICNWAGPGNSHALSNKFQSQTAEMATAATTFTLATGGSKLTYAPTNNCDSTTTQYDANVNGSIGSGEGTATANNLDAPTGSRSVQQEIEARGFAIPSLF